MKAFFVTGEPSGDLHASNLIKSLQKINPEIQFIGIGGEKMKEVGVNIIYPSDKICVVGFSEVLSKIKNVTEARKEISCIVRKENIDFAVTIDFPGFNIPIARYFENNRIPVFYFITPQVWAWGTWRVKQLNKYFKHLFVIFPFEENFLKSKLTNVSFLGNPLIDITIPSGELKREDFPECELLVSILPGSREAEIRRLFIPMLLAYKIFKKKHPESNAVIALYNEKLLPLIKRIGGEHLKDIPVFCSKTYDVLEYSDLSIISSGTATVEAGILKVPMVIVYKLSFISWSIAKTLAHVKNFGLINLIFQDNVVPELFQNEVNPKSISIALEKVYKDRFKIKKKFNELRNLLGNKGSYDRVANSILSMVQ